MLPFRLTCRRLRPKFNKSPLVIMMGMIVFVLFRSVSGSEETVGTVLQANKTSCFGFIHTSILVSSAFLQKNPFIVSSNPCGMWKGNSHHTFSFFARRQCKGRVRVSKRMIFLETFQRGRGAHFQSGNLYCRFCTFKQVFFSGKIAIKFSENEGGRGFEDRLEFFRNFI